MGASLYIGKHLRLEPPGDDGGDLALVGSCLDCTNISWQSIGELRELAAERFDILPEAWPFYDVELEEELPLDEVRSKCAHLRSILSRHVLEDLPDDYWLRFLARMLREGFDFCAKGW